MFLLAKIGGFSDKNFTNAVKLAQTAQDAADKATASATASGAKLQQSLDGKITVSTVAPGNDDAAGHNKGDVWYVTSSDGSTYTAMYNFSGISWTQQQWDQQTLSVKNLSALSANLGSVSAGSIDGVDISGSTIKSGSITGSTIHLASGTDEYWLDYNGFHMIDNAIKSGTWVLPGLIYVGGTKANPRVTVSADGIDAGSNRIYTNGMAMSAGSVFGVTSGDIYFETGIGDSGQNMANIHGGSVTGNGLSISGHTIACSDGGALYLERYGGGGSMADIHTADVHAASVYSGSTKLKSALSAKRDISDYSLDEALSAIMNTDVKKWKYKDSDNSTNSQHIGPIIDDVNTIGNKTASIANDMVSTDDDGNYFLNESNTISILLAAVKKSNQRIDELSYRIAQLERKNIK